MSTVDPLEVSFQKLIAEEVGCRPQQIAAASQLFADGSTVPFVARYRKEATGGLDDAALETIHKRRDYFLEVATRVVGGVWEAEVVVPWAAFSAAATDVGERDLWIRVERQARRPARRTAWPSAPGKAFEHAARLRIRREDAIVASMESDALALTNRSHTPTDVRIAVKPRKGCAALDGRVVRLEGGARGGVSIPAACAVSGSSVSVVETVGDRATRFSSAIPSLDAKPPGDVTDLSGTRGVDFRIGYYPYHSRLRVRVDTSSAVPPLPVTEARLRVLHERTSSVVVVREIDLPSSARSDLDLELPELEDGRYQAILALGSMAGEELVLEQHFDHKKFGWERNELGLDDIVIPPFEPLRVSDGAVSAVLRTHALGEQGLLDQIDSLDRPLLAGPMRFEASVGGVSAIVASRSAVEVTRRTETEVEWRSDLLLGSVRARVDARMEIDGLIMVDLELPAQPGEKIDRLDLVIPVRDDVARLMNAVTDRTHHHYSGEIPNGTGIVWESRLAPRVEFEGTLVPYLWLGDESRGLAWFAAGTRDWVVAEGESIQWLERGEGHVELRVRFIGSRQELTRSRRLSFGLQATPTKPTMPMPAWRLWQPQCTEEPPVKSLCILGSGWEWGAATAFGDFYVAAGNEGILASLQRTRETGTVEKGVVIDGFVDESPDTHAQRRSVEVSTTGSG